MTCPNCQATMPLYETICRSCGTNIIPLSPKDTRLLRRIDCGPLFPTTPFDPSSTNDLVTAVLDDPTQHDTGSEDIHRLYQWADIQQLDQAQLNLQADGVWGNSYRHWHKEVFLRNRTEANMPRNMLVIGVPENAAQMRFLLDTYPSARIQGIEINPKNVEGALATLTRTHPKDVESGKVSVRAGDAAELLPTLPKGSFDFVEADKVIVHLDPATRKAIYQIVMELLAPKGVFHISDIAATTIRAGAAAGFEDNPRTRDALEFYKKAMFRTFDVSFTQRGRVMWDSIEHMAGEALEYAPGLSLDSSLSLAYEAPFAGPETREGVITKIFLVMPFAGIEAARKRAGTPELEAISKQLREMGLRSVSALDTEGVLTALPDNCHLTLERPA